MNFVDVVFVVAATVCVLSALLIVSQRNPVYSVVYMLPLFLGMTTIFTLLSATFLAAMQMMVYGGAILVVFLFVIMLINLRPEEIKDDFSWLPWGFSALSVGLLCGGLISFIWKGVGGAADTVAANPELAQTLQGAFAKAPPVLKQAGQQPDVIFGSIESIAIPLFKQFVVPFEIASILIVVAILGAVLLSKKRV